MLMSTNQNQVSPASEGKPQLGFLGLGAMGSRLAMRLLKAGYPLTVYDRTHERTQPLAQLGARTATTPAEVAATSAVVFSSLADDAAVEAVLQGPEGALAGARQGTTFIEMSTILPTTSRAVAAAALARGMRLLDVAISGSTPQVEAGTITLLAGGDQAVYESCLPILSTLTERCFYMGPSGMGTTMKLVVNTLLGVEMQALGEALALGEKAGLDKSRLLDVLGETALISPRQKLALENVRREEYPVTFALRLMYKDYGLILNEAAALHVPMPMTAIAAQMSAALLASREQADAAGAVEEDEEDVTATIRWMEELAGTAPPEAADDAITGQA
jgi:3-hydroxyisobutyrate dehydrogenase-like beta-hydroxyacid dehydrogenase